MEKLTEVYKHFHGCEFPSLQVAQSKYISHCLHVERYWKVTKHTYVIKFHMCCLTWSSSFNVNLATTVHVKCFPHLVSFLHPQPRSRNSLWTRCCGRRWQRYLCPHWEQKRGKEEEIRTTLTPNYSKRWMFRMYIYPTL